MKRFTLALSLVIALCFGAIGQNPTVNAPQYQVNLSFLTGGPYAQASALDVTFGSQFTATHRLQADFITMPSANYTGYFGGDSWDLPVCSFLATTSLSCGKFQPFITGQAGLARLQIGSAPSTLGPAGLIGIGAGYDPSGSGRFGLLFKGGWGHFGPSIAATSLNPAMSGNGFFFYSGFNFGGGSSASATQVKLMRMNRASAKKMKRLQEKAAKADKS
jgi:hypothetical protein